MYCFGSPHPSGFNAAFSPDDGYMDPHGVLMGFRRKAVSLGITYLKDRVVDFDVAGKHYTSGSWVVKTAQAFRPHVLDMFEPQDHPNDFQYPGGPPIPPYDNAGWTLAYQMGIQFDRILDDFTGPLEMAEDPVRM